MWNVCKSRCDCLYQFCSSCVAFAKYLSLSFCCCVLGMILMSLVLMVYYGLFITFTPFVATEPHTAVTHEHVNSFDQLYPEINNEDEPLDENKPPINKIQTGYRQRRSQSPEIQQLSTPKLNSESLSSSKLLSSTISKRENQATSSVSSATDKPKNFKSMFKETISQTTESPDTIPDFQLSNHLVDSVFSAAEAAGMKEPLGLCRKHADVKVPEVKATLFPSEQAGNIYMKFLLINLELEPATHVRTFPRAERRCKQGEGK